jgi:hypothetical protein
MVADNALPERIQYLYTFRFANGAEKQFEVNLNAATLELVSNANVPKPDWTKLAYDQCERCPLADTVAHCPIAVNLSSLVESFKDSLSFENTTVTVQTHQRTYTKQTTLQQGLSSIIGIYMVTSSCPVMDKLRPNVRFHLPFASGEETIYRAVSMYLTAQYFRMRRGETPDWTLEHLSEIYKGVWLVNKGISQRLSHASAQDANVNAVIVLSTFGSNLDDYLEDSLKEIEPLFSDHTKPAQP